MYSDTWFPDFDSEKCESSLFNIRLNLDVAMSPTDRWDWIVSSWSRHQSNSSSVSIASRLLWSICFIESRCPLETGGPAVGVVEVPPVALGPPELPLTDPRPPLVVVDTVVAESLDPVDGKPAPDPRDDEWWRDGWNEWPKLAADDRRHSRFLQNEVKKVNYFWVKMFPLLPK